MKKLIALVMTLMMTCIAFADGLPDALTLVDQLTVEELTQLSVAVHGRMLKERGEPVAVGGGVFLVGEDIPAGAWTINAVSSSGILTVYESMEEYKKPLGQKWPVYEVYLDETYGTTKVECLRLEPGNVLTISCPVTITRFAGIGF